MKVHELIAKLSHYDMDMDVGYIASDYIYFESYTDVEVREEDIYEPSIMEDGSVGSSFKVTKNVLVLS